MKVKCSYCGQYFDDSAEKCPSCGAPNDHIHRTSDSIPKTIEELKAYCDENGLTPERTRFFVGVDYKEPKAPEITSFSLFRSCRLTMSDAAEFSIMWSVRRRRLSSPSSVSRQPG